MARFVRCRVLSPRVLVVVPCSPRDLALRQQLAVLQARRSARSCGSATVSSGSGCCGFGRAGVVADDRQTRDGCPLACEAFDSTGAGIRGRSAAVPRPRLRSARSFTDGATEPAVGSAADPVRVGAARTYGRRVDGGEIHEPSAQVASRPGARSREPRADIVAIDFFVVATISFRLLYCFLVLPRPPAARARPLQRKHLIHARWTLSKSWSLPVDTAPRFLIRDHDGIYGRTSARRQAPWALRKSSSRIARPGKTRTSSD